MSELFIIRHGQAQSRAPSDAERELTEIGQQQVLLNAKQHLAHKRFDYVFVSPYVRAQQTWQLIQSQGTQAKQVQTVDWVTPDVPTQPAIDHLLQVPEGLSVLVVSHQPFSGRLVTHLCEGSTSGMHLDTATIAHLKAEVFAASCATLIGCYSA